MLNNNDGAIEVTSGTLKLSGGSDHSTTNTITVASGGTLEFAGGNHFLGEDHTLSGAGAVVVSAGTVDLTGSGTYQLTGTTTVSGGALDVAGQLVNIGSSETRTFPGAILVGAGGDISVSGKVVEVLATNTLVSESSASLVNLVNGTHSFGSPMFDMTGSATASEIIDLGPAGAGSEDVTLTLGTDRPIRGSDTCPSCPLTGSLLETSGATVSGGQVVKVDTALLEATLPLLNVLAGSTMTLTGDAVTLANMAKLVAGSGLASAMIHLDGSSMTINVGSLVNVTGGTGGSYLNVLGDLIRLSNSSILSLNGTDGYVLRVSGGSVVDIVGVLVDFATTGGSGNKVKLANTYAPDLVVGGVGVRLTGGAAASQVEILGTPLRGLGTNGNVIEHVAGGAFTGSLVEVNGTSARVRIGR